MKIYAPNADYTGEVAGVAFAAGVGEIEDNEENEGRIQWFRDRGYGMGERADSDQDGANVAEKGSEKPLSKMGRDELNEVALGKGILGAADMQNKEEVIAAIQAADEGAAEG